VKRNESMVWRMSQAWVFQRLRLSLSRNAWAVLLGGSRVKVVSIALLSIIVGGTVGAASWYGFHLMFIREISSFSGIIGLLFDFLFLSLSVMLFFSSGIIVYSSLFSSPE